MGLSLNSLIYLRLIFEIGTWKIKFSEMANSPKSVEKVLYFISIILKFCITFLASW